MSAGSAARLIGDALDLRHRLPQVWAATQAGQGPVYQARHIAYTTRHLTGDQAGFVDHRITPALGTVSYGRLQTLLDAAVMEADPDGAEQRAAAAAQERFVRLGRSSEHGLKLIIARATAGDALWFKATIDRIADILARQGDQDPVDVRRSKAIGILAQPVEAVRLLSDHQDDHWHGPAEPDDLDLEPADNQTDPDWPCGEQPIQNETDHDQTVASDTADTGKVDQQPAASGPDSSDQAPHQSLKITPPPFDPHKARPRAIIYVHLSVEALTAGTGICRVENIGPILLNRLQTLLGEHCSINLKPVIDLPAGHIPLDCYEIPASLREQLLLRHPADIFPYANTVTRGVDIDHTIAYLSPDDGGPPGQTRIGNLGPHVRYHHRVKTFAGWQVCQPEPGTWLWRSPHGRIYLINPTGTHRLGNTQFAQTIWRTATDPPQTLEADPDLAGSGR